MSKDSRYDVCIIDGFNQDDIIPLDDYVFVKISLPPKLNSSGLLKTSREVTDEGNRKLYGDIIAKGPKVIFVDVEDRVMFNQFSGTVVVRKESTGEENGVEYRLMSENNLISKLKKKGE